ncbi:MAG: sigma-70 family RNA polymerase sigma factor [Leptolyngbyaceae cyanobacterium bins.302]|nr:sigma-70 family RNA polymerase sigma factor [Leptolyngbyaceae cyanobacterium bins.302]
MPAAQSSKQSQTDWQSKVHELVLEARKHSSNTQKRNYYLTQIIRLVAPRLWKFYTPYYPDALQQTWVYFVKNVCTTYDPNRASVVSWLNHYLRYRHLDLMRQALKQQHHEVSIDAENNGENSSSLKLGDTLTRDYGSLSLLEEVTHWIEADDNDELKHVHVKHRPDINCQTLILLRLPPETPWKDISAQYGVPIPTLNSFYRRNCIPYLQKLAASMVK